MSSNDIARPTCYGDRIKRPGRKTNKNSHSPTTVDIVLTEDGPRFYCPACETLIDEMWGTHVDELVDDLEGDLEGNVRTVDMETE